MPFGQLVIGPAGSGKTTYCSGVAQMMNALGRPAVIVNLDPGNENVPYQAAVDIRELVSVPVVMEEMGLGINGALVYSMEYIVANLDWLQERLKPLRDKSASARVSYVLFDCPGQVELYTHHDAMVTLAGFRMVAMNLIDGMIHLEMPHVNVLSKIDLVNSGGGGLGAGSGGGASMFSEPHFSLDFYLGSQSLDKLLPFLGDSSAAGLDGRWAKLNETLVEIIDDHSLVQFAPLCITDADCVKACVRLADKANGYIFGSLDASDSGSLHYAATAEQEIEFAKFLCDVEEKFKADAPDKD